MQLGQSLKSRSVDPICDSVLEMAGTQIDLQSQAVLVSLRLRF